MSIIKSSKLNRTSAIKFTFSVIHFSFRNIIFLELLKSKYHTTYKINYLRYKLLLSLLLYFIMKLFSKFPPSFLCTSLSPISFFCKILFFSYFWTRLSRPAVFFPSQSFPPPPSLCLFLSRSVFPLSRIILTPSQSTLSPSQPRSPIAPSSPLRSS